MPFVDEAVKGDPSIFPPPEVMAKLFTDRDLRTAGGPDDHPALDQGADRAIAGAAAVRGGFSRRPGWRSSPAPAAPAEEIHVYNWADYIGPDTLAAFEAETGIEVVYDVFDSNEVLEAKLLAGSSGYDVVVPTSTFLRRQIPAEVYQTLDREKLPHWKNLDPALLRSAEADDPGNAYGAVYLWGTNGIGYNVAEVAERLGEEAPVDSWALVFDPRRREARRLRHHHARHRLGDGAAGARLSRADRRIRPGPSDLEKAAALFEAVRPYVRYFNAVAVHYDLAAGEVCVSVGFSGDVFMAADRGRRGGGDRLFGAEGRRHALVRHAGDPGRRAEPGRGACLHRLPAQARR